MVEPAIATMLFREWDLPLYSAEDAPVSGSTIKQDLKPRMELSSCSVGDVLLCCSKMQSFSSPGTEHDGDKCRKPSRDITPAHLSSIKEGVSYKLFTSA